MINAACTLYGENLWISPYVFSSFVALREKGIAFNLVELSLADGQALQAPFRDHSITARVPSLEHEGFHLAESSAIAEYLDEVFPAPTYPALFPADRRERARARQLMAWLRSDLAALRDDRSTVTMFYRFKSQPLSPAAARDTEKLVRVAEQLIPANGGPLFGAWCLVDSELAFMLHRLILNGDDVPARVRAYAAQQWSRPSVQEFVEHPRPATVPASYWARSGTPQPESGLRPA
ncbi:MAG: glutathione transferase [Candidatus Binatia bacterium]